jgi:signal recognition particle subunit SRP54
MRKGVFDLEDLSDQLKQMEKIGGMSGVLSMLPGIGKVKKQIEEADLDNTVVKRQQAIISSMTQRERRVPKLLNASRKKRVAAGSGTTVQDINKLLKMHRTMADMMKKMSKGKGGLAAMFGGGGGMPEMPEGMDPGAAPPGLPGVPPGMPQGFPGLGGGGGLPPGLPGLPGKKK